MKVNNGPGLLFGEEVIGDVEDEFRNEVGEYLDGNWEFGEKLEGEVLGKEEGLECALGAEWFT